MQKGSYSLHLFLVALAILLAGCSSAPKPEPESFTTLSAMEARVSAYSAWVGQHRREINDLKALMTPFMTDQMRLNFSFYERIQPSYEAMISAYDSITGLGQAQYRLVKRLKRRKNPDIHSQIRGRDQTYAERFTENDYSIRRSEYILDYHKDKLRKFFKKENLRLIFIQDQYAAWMVDVRSLQTRRETLTAAENTLLHEFSRSIEKRHQPGRFAVKRLKRINAIKETLDTLDKILTEMDRQAVSEVQSTVFIAPIGSPPKEYEKRYKKSMETYEKLLAELDKYLPD